MLSKEKIIEVIKKDSNYNGHGRFRRDFMDEEMLLIHEYQHASKLGRLLTFSGKEMTWTLGSSPIKVTIVADDGRQLLVKEITLYDGTTIVEWWLVDKNHRLTAARSIAPAFAIYFPFCEIP